MFVVVATGISALSTTAFAADTWYDPAALETSCVQNVDGLGKADTCRFEPASKENYTGAITQVSSNTANCTGEATTKTVTWQQDTTQEDSIAVDTTVSATLSTIFGLAITASYGHTWSYTNSVADTETVPLDPYHIGWIDRGAPMQRITGRMVINYPKRRYGHYEWYTYPTLTAADPQAPSFETLILQSRPMTQAEIASMCASSSSSLALVKPKAAIEQSAPTTPGTPTSTVIKKAAPAQTTVTTPNLNTTIEHAAS